MRCTGHCCKNFPLPYSPEELKKKYEDWRNDVPDSNHPQDIFLIYPMVTYIGVDSNHSPIHRYDCKHLKENGDCSIYENRPRMCSGYPYGEPCRKEGCTLK